MANRGRLVSNVLLCNCDRALLNESRALVGVSPWALAAVASSPHLPMVMKAHPDVSRDVRNTAVHQVIHKDVLLPAVDVGSTAAVTTAPFHGMEPEASLFPFPD